MSEQNNGLKIEDQIKHGLNGDVQKNALDFANFLRTNNFSAEWNEKHDGWNVIYKGWNMVFSKVISDENVFAIVFNTCDFDGDGPADDDVREFAWAHVVVCPRGCGSATICEMSQKHIKVFGKEYENICVAPLECFNLDGKDLENAKRLMLMLKQKRSAEK